MRKFGNYLRNVRRVSGMTQQQAAEALGMDRSVYSYYETDKLLPDAATLWKLSKLYHRPHEEMVRVIIEQQTDYYAQPLE